MEIVNRIQSSFSILRHRQRNHFKMYGKKKKYVSYRRHIRAETTTASAVIRTHSRVQPTVTMATVRLAVTMATSNQRTRRQVFNIIITWLQRTRAAFTRPINMPRTIITHRRHRRPRRIEPSALRWRKARKPPTYDVPSSATKAVHVVQRYRNLWDLRTYYYASLAPARSHVFVRTHATMWYCIAFLLYVCSCSWHGSYHCNGFSMNRRASQWRSGVCAVRDSSTF